MLMMILGNAAQDSSASGAGLDIPALNNLHGRQDSNQQFPGYSVLGRLIGGSVDSQSQKT